MKSYKLFLSSLNYDISFYTLLMIDNLHNLRNLQLEIDIIYN